jgi:biopolymer transport protein ExbB
MKKLVVMKRFLGVLALCCAVVVPGFAQAQTEEPQTVRAASLDELLRLVEERRVVESREHRDREQRFVQERNNQQQLLQQARNERTQEEQRSERLEATFEQNEIRIGQLQERLDERLGALREMFGVLQEVAGDTRGQFDVSIISAQYPGRGEWLDQLAQRMGAGTRLASIEEMERLWFELQREMTETGRVAQFSGVVNMLDGEQRETQIYRVGAFNVVADNRYINYQPEVNALVELARQPSARFANTARNLARAQPGELVPFAVDPTRGSLLDLLIQADTWGKRIGTVFGGIRTGDCYLPFCDGQGGVVGSVIILAGIVGVLLSLERLLTLSLIARRVNVQRNSDEIDEGNPLGRVLKVYSDNKNVDIETLELKLGEAILAETPRLTRNIGLIQVISVVAPLLGLLGTVIGMILTFQAITLFGTGDPQTMAAGISTALVTTVLGLTVAIPTVLLHSIVNARSKSVIHVLEEQSAGIIAEHAERSGRALG